MKNLLRIVAVFLALFTSIAWAQSNRISTDNSQAVPVITGSVDDSNLVTLSGNTRPEANARNDRGRVEDTFPLDHMFLQLKRPPAQEQALQKYIDQLHDPASPYFHQWLTAKQLGERYGLAQSDIHKITGWLMLHGFAVNSVAPSRMTIDFSGTAGQVRLAFHTEIHKLQVNGVDHIANMSDPQIPAALVPAVAGVVSLHNFMPHPMYEARTNYTVGGNYLVVPADFATIYNLNPLFAKGYSGKGQTIVVVEDTDLYSTSDWTNFRSTFGLSSYTAGSLTQVHPGSGCTDPHTNSDDVEATLDVEWASAAAPDAAIELASCANTTNFGGFIALQNLLNGSKPPAIVSVSYGESETDDTAAFNAAINSLYQQAVSEGVSVFVSSGDQLAAVSDGGNPYAMYGINVNGWGSTIYNVAVGGTDFGDTYAGTNTTYWNSTNSGTYGSALSYIPEIPWNDSCASLLIAKFEGYTTTYGTSGFCNSSPGAPFLDVVGGSGGPSACATGTPSTQHVVSGTCKGYAKPSWQSVLGNPADGVRDLPDVSLFAANGVWGHAYVICYSDPTYGGVPCTGAPSGWLEAGGTSFSSPIMAAIQSLVNQATGKSWGNPNPTYYSLAAAEYGASGSSACNSTKGNTVGSSCIFYDVTEGDNDAPCKGTHNCYLPSGTYGVLSTSNFAFKPAYTTQTGWDFSTGIGTINAYNLVTGWNASGTPTTTTLTLSASAINFGTASVTLTATVTLKSGTPTGTVTFYNNGTEISQTGNPATLASGKAALTYNTSALAVGTYSITATYNPTGSFASSTSAPSQLQVQDFTLSAPNPTTVTISAPGQSGKTVITITPLGGFNQTPAFTCAPLPSEANCTAAGTATSQTITFTTVAASRLRESPFGRHGGVFYAMLLPGLFGLVWPAGSRKRMIRLVALIAILACLTLWMPACGGGSTSTSNPGTPTGTTSVSITATSGSLHHSVQVQLTVQ